MTVPPRPLEAIVLHPLTQPFSLPLSPLEAAAAAILVVLTVVLAWPEKNGHPLPAAKARGDLDGQTASWSGRLSRPQVATRGMAVALMLLAIAAGRLGLDNELENLAPALVVGAGWPMLVILSVFVGNVWRWVDPWDAAARVLVRDEHGAGSEHVWSALLPAVGWTWYLSVLTSPLSPPAVAAALSAYSIFTLAGCLANGRVRWLSAAEPLGILLSWMTLLPAGRLGRWNPPRGAEALLGVMIGGVLFGRVRRSELWGALNIAPAALLYATVGLVLCCAVFAGLLVLLSRCANRVGSKALVARATVPALAALIVAVAMERNRLFTSLQLLPGLLGDPFGLGWDLFGRAGAGLNPAPFGTAGLAMGQLAVLVIGHVAGAIVLARGARRRQRGPGATGLAILTGCSVVGLLAH